MRRAALLALLLGLPAFAAPGPLTTKLRKPGRGFPLRTSHFEVPVGAREICQAIHLPLDHPIDIDRMVIKMPTCSTIANHHFAMFLADSAAPNLPLDCP